MKNIVTLLIFLMIGTSYAQEITDYKYISVPLKFSNFETNQYTLNSQLKVLLKQKGYTPLSESKDYWPEEAKLNPCRVLSADVLDNSSFIKIKIKVTFKDCNHNPVLETEATTNIKAYEEGFSDALQNAVASFGDSNAQDDMVTPTQKEVTIIKKTTRPVATQELLPIDKRSEAETQTQVISNTATLKNVAVKIAAIDNGEFIVIDSKTSSILAHFYPAKMQGVFHVRVNNPAGQGYYTIGYKDSHGKLSYEQTQDFENWSLITID